MSSKAQIPRTGWGGKINVRKPQNGFLKASWQNDREVVDTRTWGEIRKTGCFLMARVVHFSCRFLVHFSMSLDI